PNGRPGKCRSCAVSMSGSRTTPWSTCRRRPHAVQRTSSGPRNLLRLRLVNSRSGARPPPSVQEEAPSHVLVADVAVSHRLLPARRAPLAAAVLRRLSLRAALRDPRDSVHARARRLQAADGAADGAVRDGDRRAGAWTGVPGGARGGPHAAPAVRVRGVLRVGDLPVLLAAASGVARRRFPAASAVPD